MARANNILVSMFREPKDTHFSRAIMVAVSILLIFTCIWFFVNTPQSDSIRDVALIYTLLLIFAFLVISSDTLAEMVGVRATSRKKLMSAFSIGSIGNAGFAFVLAVGLWLFLNFCKINFTKQVPELGVESVQSFFFFVIIAATVEETLRYVFTPTFISILNANRINPVVSVIASVGICSIGFGILHYAAYNMSLNLMIFAMMYALIFTLGNYFTRSALFSITLHMLHNAGAYLGQYGLPDISLWMFGVVFIAVSLVSVYLLARFIDDLRSRGLNRIIQS